MNMARVVVSTAAAALVFLCSCTTSTPDRLAATSATPNTAPPRGTAHITEIHSPDHIVINNESDDTQVATFGLNANAPIARFDGKLHTEFEGDEIKVGWHTMGCAGGLHSGLALHIGTIEQGQLTVEVIEQVPDEKGRPCTADVKAAGAILRLDDDTSVTRVQLKQFLNGQLERSKVTSRRTDSAT